MLHSFKLLLLASWIPLIVFGAPGAKTLTFYTIDVEGGKSVLIVSPSGESMLFDAGWPGARNREASTGQIVAALKGAGLKQLDYLVISHFDVDHLGDVPALADQIPIRHIMDHGQMQFPPDPANTQSKAPPVNNPGFPSGRDRFNAYAELRQKIGHTVLKPGDRIPLKGVGIEVVASAGRLPGKPLKGAGAANPLCATNPQAAPIERDVEDDQSVGLLFTFGKFRMLDLADLEAHLSHELVCPVNLIGTVDVYHVNVHGQFKGMAAELTGAVRPTVAIMGNAARKGADPATWPILRATAGLEDIWQVHYSAAGSQDTNPPPDFIANLEQPAHEFAMIKLVVQSDGTYVVTNTRNGFTKTYKAGMAGGKKKPEAQRTAQSVVALDGFHNNESKMPDHYQWDGVRPGGFSEFGKVLVGLGARLTTIRERVTPAALAGVRIFIIVDPDTPAETADPQYIMPDEIVAIEQWVRAGGRLVLLGNDKGNAEFEHFNQLAGRFGIEFLEDTYPKVKGKGILIARGETPIFEGAPEVYLVEVAPLKVSADVKILLADQGTPIMALAQAGKGKVFALGDPWIYNEYIDSRNNRAIAANLFRSLLK